MKSMTGFGYAESQNERMSIAVEVKSYNHRYLDILVSLPPYLNALEPDLRARVPLHHLERVLSLVGRQQTASGKWWHNRRGWHRAGRLAILASKHSLPAMDGPGPRGRKLRSAGW